MIYIYNESQQQPYWQIAYHQLHEKYLALQAAYSKALETIQEAASKAQDLKKENESLKNMQTASNISLPLDIDNSSFDPQIPQSEKQITVEAAKKRKPRIRKQISTEIDSKASASIYECTYPECHKVYSSPVSMNLHIKQKHNGGTKKERQAIAKILLQAKDKGQEPPQFDINLPPNFLQQFRTTYEYMKKYNM